MDIEREGSFDVNINHPNLTNYDTVSFSDLPAGSTTIAIGFRNNATRGVVLSMNCTNAGDLLSGIIFG